MGTLSLTTSGLRRRPPLALGSALVCPLPPVVCIAGRGWPVYGLCVCGGALIAATWMTALAAASGTSPRSALLQALIGIAAALALAHATKAATGGERFTFYHYQLAVLAAGGAAAAGMDRPALAGLDVLAVGLAVAHGVGRLGCLAAGCCHGRAVPWGIRYGSAHAADGFPRELVGVPLLPVQALESLVLFALAAAGSFLVVAGGAGAGPAAGSALALYIGGYGTARFLFEIWRGDRRPSFGGLSEAQWTALLALAAVAALGAVGVLPLGGVATGACFAVGAGLAALAAARRQRSLQSAGLLDGPHATELAAMLARLESCEPSRGGVPIAVSSRGLRLSTTLLAEPSGPVRLISFSTAARDLGDRAAAAVARGLLRMCPGARQGQLLTADEPEIWHLLVRGPVAGAEVKRQA